ncbi:hypothetical protein D3C74_411750 [compost metagenome]
MKLPGSINGYDTEILNGGFGTVPRASGDRQFYFGRSDHLVEFFLRTNTHLDRILCTEATERITYTCFYCP